jgi:hypothetical protein
MKANFSCAELGNDSSRPGKGTDFLDRAEELRLRYIIGVVAGRLKVTGVSNHGNSQAEAAIGAQANGVPRDVNIKRKTASLIYMTVPYPPDLRS